MVLGEHPPAGYPELLMCELDGDAFDAQAALAALEETVNRLLPHLAEICHGISK